MGAVGVQHEGVHFGLQLGLAADALVPPIVVPRISAPVGNRAPVGADFHGSGGLYVLHLIDILRDLLFNSYFVFAGIGDGCKSFVSETGEPEIDRK